VTFKNNIASSNWGGAIRMNSSSATISILNSDFTNNSNSGATSYGGAIMIWSGIVIVKDTLFYNNSCTTFGGNGGAISVQGGSLSIDRSLFSSNSGHDGGAIHFSGGTSVDINNSTFYNNTSDQGGAFFASSGTHTISSSTFVSNTITINNVGAALNGAGSTLTVTGSIFSGNLDPTDSDTCLATVDGGYNLEDGTTCSWSVAGGAGSTTLSLGALSDNGGVTQTFPLLPGSPAIDKGIVGCSNDQRNYPRTDGSCDAGAFEL
ncbi:MAG: right-handed parallel beta-helix repeat-containing protein, partial [Halobacteriovoraceae bacterium]|nr:right-handed parallel beta-helix repeat-containing protein [Halobacteriovoraceae bacterium]